MRAQAQFRLLGEAISLQLTAVTNEGSLTATDPTFHNACVAALRRCADLINPSFGQVDYRYPTDVTGLESMIPGLIPRDRVLAARTKFRGYSRITILSQELAQQVDIAELEGAFPEVAWLDHGGLWIKAAPHYREYGAAQVAELGRLLGELFEIQGFEQPSVSPGAPPWRVHVPSQTSRFACEWHSECDPAEQHLDGSVAE